MREQNAARAAAPEQGMARALRYRWLIYGLMALTYFFVYFHRMSSGVVKEDLIGAFGLSGTGYSQLNSMYFYSYMFMQIPSGILADTLGARKTVTAGCLAMSVGAFLFGMSQNVPMLMLSRLLVGLGASVIFIAILKVQTQWFRESEFGFMSGVTGFVGNLGGAMAQGPLAALVGLLTWRMSFVCIGAFTLVLTLLGWLVIRNRPQDMGFPPVNPEPKWKQRPPVIKALGRVLVNPRSWPSFFINCFFSGCSMAFTTWGVSYLTHCYGVSVLEAGGMTFWYPIGMALGSVTIGYASDRLKRRKLPLLVSAVGSCICWGLLAFTQPSLMEVRIILPVMGFFGAFIVVSLSVAKEVNDPRFSGMSTSLANMGLFLGGAVIPVFFGGLIDKYTGALEGFALYQVPLKMCFGIVLMGFLSCVLTKETRCRNLFAEKMREEKQV